MNHLLAINLKGLSVERIVEIFGRDLYLANGVDTTGRKPSKSKPVIHRMTLFCGNHQILFPLNTFFEKIAKYSHVFDRLIFPPYSVSRTCTCTRTV